MPAVPYALAAKLAYPNRPVIACLGDGSMQMLGNAALIDLAHHAERWSNQQCIVLVLHTDDLNQVTWEQRMLSGDPKLQASQVLPDLPFARYVEVIGLKGITGGAPGRVGRPDRDEALSLWGRVVYESVKGKVVEFLHH